MKGGDQKLGCGEGCAGYEDRWPDLKHGAKAGKGPDQPEGNDDTEGGEHAADDARENERVEAGDAVKCDDGGAEGTKGDGGGVGQKREAGGLKGSEAHSDEDGSADG